MMLDQDVVAVSPASVWQVLKQAGLLSRWKAQPSRKRPGFEQPLQPHQHWHIDVSYINVGGTLLLPLERSGWLQSFYRALGSAGIDEGNGYRSDFGTCQGEISGGQTADDFRMNRPNIRLHCKQICFALRSSTLFLIIIRNSL